MSERTIEEMKRELGGSPPIDKSEWGPGPWQTEPDRLEFEHLGFPCLITRSPHGGNLCGYVAMPPGHPWHGKHYNDIEVDVHGGPTYSEFCAGDVCHVPKPGEPDNVYWIGFDMAHCDDLSPSSRRFRLPSHEDCDTYRTIDYVRAECESVARQAKAAQS